MAALSLSGLWLLPRTTSQVRFTDKRPLDEHPIPSLNGHCGLFSCAIGCLGSWPPESQRNASAIVAQLSWPCSTSPLHFFDHQLGDLLARWSGTALLDVAGYTEEALRTLRSMEGRRCFSRRGQRHGRTRRLVGARCRSDSRWLGRAGCCSWLPWCFGVDKPWDVFSWRDGNRRGLSERRYFFANILLDRLHCRNVSRHLLLSLR